LSGRKLEAIVRKVDLSCLIHLTLLLGVMVPLARMRLVDIVLKIDLSIDNYDRDPLDFYMTNNIINLTSNKKNYNDLVVRIYLFIR
jgi:hypothetical protein